MILSLRCIKAILSGALAVACGAAFAQGHATPADSPYDELLSIARTTGDLPPAEQVAKVEQRYWALFPAKDLHTKSVAELDEMLRATLAAASYTRVPGIAKRSTQILEALTAKQGATSQRIAAAFDALLAASEMDAAAELAREHPEARLPLLPDRETDASFVPGEPAEWALSSDAATMTRRAVPHGKGVEIIVVAHPLCHFSQDAVAAISQNASLAAAFASHAHWITPPLQEGDFEVIPEWNREHPRFAMTSVYDPNRWKGFDFRETPVFYFLVDGAIRQVIRGWPGDGQLANLEHAVEMLTRQATTASGTTQQAPREAQAPQGQAAASTRK